MPPEVISEPLVHIHAITDVGRSRTHNEDNFIVCPDLKGKRWYLSDIPEKISDSGCLMVVADGMGGANAGEVASEIAVEAVQRMFDTLKIEGKIEEEQAKDYLYQAILGAHKEIIAASDENPEYVGMGTTILVVWVFSGKAILAWCGDSRAYLYRKKTGTEILTKDHSLVWELVEAGKLTPDEADVHPDSNIITQSLGDKKNTPRPDFMVCSLEEKDRLLLCSDGLNNMVDHKTIGEILGEEIPLADVNRKLVEAANEKGGADNITVLLLEVLQVPPKEKKAKYLWLFTGISILFFIGLVFYFLRIPASLFGTFDQPDKYSAEAEVEVYSSTEATSALPIILKDKSYLQHGTGESETTINIPPIKEVAKTEQKEEIELLVPEVVQVLKTYHFLDSAVTYQWPQLQLRNKDWQQDSLIIAQGAIVSDLPNQDEELIQLINKYELGKGKGTTEEQEFLYSLSEKYQLSLQEILMELSRIEYLINQKTAH